MYNDKNLKGAEVVLALRRDLVYVVDDDHDVRVALAALLRAHGYDVDTHASADEFLDVPASQSPSCLLLDVRLGALSGLDLQRRLNRACSGIPVVLITGFGDVPMTVRAMKDGAVDVLSKPLHSEAVLAAVRDALALSRCLQEARSLSEAMHRRFADLTEREREVMGLVAAGLMNKQIAARLELSEITVKIHRGNAMRKMQAASLADLVRMAEALGATAAAGRYDRNRIGQTQAQRQVRR